MSKFIGSLLNYTTGENDMPAFKSTLNPVLDLFYRIGNRVKRVFGNNPNFNEVISLAVNALKHDFNLAVKVIGWSRSVREGAGIRDYLRTILQRGIIKYSDVNWTWFARHGYWKDVFFFNPDDLDSYSKYSILAAIRDGIKNKDNLLLKYLPRRKRFNKSHKNNKWIYSIRAFLNITDEQYRRICIQYVSPEALMCAGKWHEINYEHLPGKCMQKNHKSFLKHDEARYKDYLNKLVKGTAKAKAGALYPHEILMMLHKNPSLAEGQWKGLPDTFKSDKKIFVVADTSLSMIGMPVMISKALAIFFSERLTGDFKNFCAIFSEVPVFIKFSEGSSLLKKYNELNTINARNTNIEALIRLMVHKIKTQNIPDEDCPDSIMIISDMQFDEGMDCPSEGIQDMLKRSYQSIGRKVPSVIYWNVANAEGIPATENEKGVMLFSGASPNTIGQALGNIIDPYESMLKVIDKEEYYFLNK